MNDQEEKYVRWNQIKEKVISYNALLVDDYIVTVP